MRLIFVCALFLGCSAYASYSSVSYPGEMFCKSDDGKLTVRINGARSILYITHEGDKSKKYWVMGNPETDSKSYVTFTAIRDYSSDKTVKVTFDDKGDRIKFPGQHHINIKCPDYQQE